MTQFDKNPSSVVLYKIFFISADHKLENFVSSELSINLLESQVINDIFSESHQLFISLFQFSITYNFAIEDKGNEVFIDSEISKSTHSSFFRLFKVSHHNKFCEKSYIVFKSSYHSFHSNSLILKSLIFQFV
ncbi:MAG: hypothetical protein Q8S84_06350 [bacterium]|nr:hypothetical protein [bacterium]MDP3381095.1 hypothetical protein [bacterium]